MHISIAFSYLHAGMMICVLGGAGYAAGILETLPESSEEPTDIQQMTTVGLNEVLAKHEAPQQMDYLDLDTGGHLLQHDL